LYYIILFYFVIKKLFLFLENKINKKNN